MGAPGHDAAHTVLADLGREKPMRPHRVPRPKLTDRVGRFALGRRVSYEAARRPLFSPIVSRISNVPIPKAVED